ncbi:hypothetical protein OJ997_35215 [Solirubrobacter phytolaccae]|uniref:Uncharacterized protein n=1 Tax=Solirubrobacter phytolaccae TaxID=1404360 RepID=A0A9X3NG47_9ACTN|nr:hypothetical protein [Solirubrobacter phytolaccae]MDA0185609.1 hypothetical protein [Solirubrobacter phytolaccae]
MSIRLITVCAALALVGCGAEDEREAAAGGGDTMAAEEWSRQVEEICDESANKAEREGIETMQKALDEGASEGEAVARVLERSAEMTEPWLDKIAAMPAPRGMEAKADEFDQRMRDMLPDIQALADMSREDTSQAELEATTQQFLEEVLPVRALARDLNIHACIPRNSQP